ncbi:MAG: metal ABC transporter permease [Bacteroidales bacterium]|nr:MAG: metal ABC transporter permease [Bacteroidales bacterium]
MEIFRYQFFLKALLAALLTSISCGIVGTYIVSKRIVFLSGGITHASFGGIGIGYFLGINPILGAAVFAVLSALGIEFISKKADIREDSVIGIWWSFGMALGIIFIFITPGYAPNLLSYLFGSILTITDVDIYMMIGLNVVLILFFSLLFKIILFISFDAEYASTYRAPVQLINYLLISLVALTIVINIRVMGIILIISLLTIPQTIANLFTKSFRNIIYVSVVLALTGCIAGLFVSYRFDIPSGASIIFILVILFLFARVYKRLAQRITIRKLS